MRFQRKRMPLISFPRCTVTWVRVQYCMAVFAWAEHFNKTGIWSKVEAGGAVLDTRKAEKQLFITSNRSASVPRQYYNQPRPPAHLWVKKKCKKCRGPFCLAITVMWPLLRSLMLLFPPAWPPRLLPKASHFVLQPHENVWAQIPSRLPELVLIWAINSPR